MISVEPLSKFPLLSTGSVDQAEVELSRSLTQCRIMKVRDDRKFGLKMNGLQLGRVSLVYNRYDVDAKVESVLPGDPVFFNVGSGAPSTLEYGGRSEVAYPGEAVLASNANRLLIDRPQGSCMTILRVWRGDLEQHLEAMTDRHLRGRLVFDADADCRGAAGASLIRLIEFLIKELDENAPIATIPSFRRCYEEMLLNAMLSLPHNRNELLFEDRQYEHSPHLVRRAEEYMRANLDETITVSDILKLCQCSRSALFAAFRNARGYSPMEFLVEERLQSVRSRLLDPDEQTTVSSAAFEGGFSHLGRFSNSYRKRFGEAPSSTLRRTKGCR